MKKLLTLLLILLLAALAFTCCTKRTDRTDGLTPPEGWYFHARVLETGENRVLAECTDRGTGGVETGTVLYVNCRVDWDGYLHALPVEVNVDDEICVFYDGRLMESDPPQVDAMEITVLPRD